MAKGSGRFRNRKLGFKSRILLQIGVVDFEEDPLDAELEFEDEKASKGVETGVDKEEEHELHLQAVIASSNASVSRPAGSSAKAKAARVFIPTPESAGTIDETTFRELYPKGYVDPVTYIRFSDTVEDATTGAVEYTMDEDDEEWLEAYNASLLPGGKAKAGGSVEDSPRRKSKADKVAKVEDKSTEPGPISEDDFEQIMELFEKTTELKAPMAHVVSSQLTADRSWVPSLTLRRFAGPFFNPRSLRHGGRLHRHPQTLPRTTQGLRSVHIPALERAATQALGQEHHPSTRRKLAPLSLASQDLSLTALF